MESKDLIDFGKRNIIPIGLGLVGLLFLIIGVFQIYTSQKSAQPDLVFEESDAQDEKPTEIIVDIEGAVMTPGVYKISSESRVVDALAKAGGLSQEADREFVEKNINLASKVTDSMKIYIPRVGEQILSENTTSSGSVSSGLGAGGPVMNINLASMSDLEALPGVGEVTAQKIIEGRPYVSIDELLSKKIIGVATFEKIKDKIAAN